MLISGIVTLTAFLLIGLGSKSEQKSPLYMVGGFVAFAFSIYLHVAAFQSVLSATAAISAEMGLGFFVLAGLLARDHKPAKSYFFLGGATLAISVVLFISLKFATSTSPAYSESFLLELGPDDSIQEVQPTLSQYDAFAESAFPTVSLLEDENLAQVYIVTVSSNRVATLMAELRLDVENVDHAELNFSVSLAEPSSSTNRSSSKTEILENDPLAASQWALDAINGHEAHAILKDLKPVRKARVAILDTGVDASHEDVVSAFTESPAIQDLHGHGSHCAGIAGASTNNGVGIASLNWEGRFIEILGYHALNEQGTGTIEMISQAIIDATKDHSDVISMSLGAKAETPKVISDAIAYARRNRVIVIASAGNANEDAIDHMPSSVDGVIVVSAVDQNLRKASFSNTNTSLKWPITAPGVDILSLKTGGGYVQMSGTSMSTPVVSGLVGVLRSINPEVTDEEVYAILNSTGQKVRDSAKIGKLIDAEAALLLILKSE